MIRVPSPAHKSPGRLAIHLPVCLAMGLIGIAQVGLAHADSQTCARVADDVIETDGIIDDWSGVARKSVGGKDRNASFTLRCAYDQKRLHLAVEVRDDYLYRGARPSTKKDDHLLIELRVTGKKSDRLIVFPANDSVDRKHTFNNKKLPKWMRVEDAQVRRGWAMEVSLPMARLRGFSKSAAAVNARIELRDADYAAKVKKRLSFNGQLTLEGADEMYRSFLAAAKLSARDITLDTMANVDDQPGLERVIAGRGLIGIVSDQFFYMQLPVTSPGDVSKVEVADLRGDGTRSIITELRQHGNGGSRDLLIVWQVSGNQLQQVLAWEIRKEKNGKVLSNRWSLVPRGKYRKGKRSRKGRDLLLEVSDSDTRGWDEDNYFERPAADVQAILTPWSDQTSAVYYFEGNSAQGGEPMPKGKRRKRR